MWQKEIVKIHTVFGGKNPHPNYLVGGVPCSIDVNEVAAINSERLNPGGPAHQPGRRIRQRGLHSRSACRGLFLQRLGPSGAGGLKNYLSYGEFPTKGLQPGGVVQVSARRGAQSRPEVTFIR